jgi:hypothetical protein
MAVLLAVLASSSAENSGVGWVLIVGVLVAIVLVIGAIWTFAARRGSRMPARSEHRHDPGVRDG